MQDRTFSFEFFPPKTAEGTAKLRATRAQLSQLKPAFCSVTFGAGGSTREGTLETVLEMIGEGIAAAPHLSCIGGSRESLRDVLQQYRAHDIRHIVALRGDPPGGVGTRFSPHPQGYRKAADLVRGIREIAPFEVSVSAYPEKHPEAVSIEEDLAFLADKAEHGATRALSQFFFNNAAFLRFRDRVMARGIKIELVPGILPITNFAKVKEFAAKCGAFLPPALGQRFHGLDADPETRNLVAAMVAAEQIDFLRREGVESFHFYTLNRADLVYAICRVVGLGQEAEAA